MSQTLTCSHKSRTNSSARLLNLAQNPIRSESRPVLRTFLHSGFVPFTKGESLSAYSLSVKATQLIPFIFLFSTQRVSRHWLSVSIWPFPPGTGVGLTPRLRGLRESFLFCGERPLPLPPAFEGWISTRSAQRAARLSYRAGAPPAAHHMTNHGKGISHYSSFHRSGSEVLWDQVKYACHCYFLIEAQRRIVRRLNLIGVIRKI